MAHARTDPGVGTACVDPFGADMCGIAAICLAEPRQWAQPSLEHMLRVQRHRGPDHTGWEVDGRATTWLGHDRLSIVDLSAAGNQPLANESGTVYAVVNGEIYNAPELRDELTRSGHRFRSGSDSEVVVHLYEELGERAVERLVGMFAFVVHDRRSGTVVAARDRVGKKPLLYAEVDGGLAIASEIPPLAGLPGVDMRIDPVALGLYLLRNFRHIPDPHTLYRGIRRLPPGHQMVIRNGRVESLRRYWSPSLRPAHVGPEDIRAALDRAIRRRLEADVEIGALLSGGVDSTAIVDSLARQGIAGIRTYALGVAPDDEELVRARRAADLLGTRHQELYFDPDDTFERYRHLQTLHGDPVALLPLAHAYALFEQVYDDGLKVVMTGHGADEVFYGYTGFLGLASVSNALRLVPAQARALARVATALAPHGTRVRDGLIVAGAAPGERKSALYRDDARRTLPTLLESGRVVPETAAAVGALFRTWFEVDARSGHHADYIDEAALIGLMHENAHSVTIASDLPAMATSIEVRAPFLDQDLVSLALSIPYRDKVGDDDSTLKLALKRALEPRLPRDLLYAPKRGFGFNVQERDLLAGAWRERVTTGLGSLGDLDGCLRPEGVAEHLDVFLARRDRESAAIVSKLFALSLALGCA